MSLRYADTSLPELLGRPSLRFAELSRGSWRLGPPLDALWFFMELDSKSRLPVSEFPSYFYSRGGWKQI